MRVIVDPEKCLTSGLCVVTDDQIFDQDEETGAVKLLLANPPPESWERAKEAARLCPGRAITVVDDE